MKALTAQIPTLTVPARDKAIGMQAEGAGTPTRLPQISVAKQISVANMPP
jgi:hypothetical protein